MENYVGFVHSHKYLGYLISLLPVISLVLVMVGGRTKPRLARTIFMISKIGYRMLGGVVLLLGLTLWYLNPEIGLFSGYIWVSLFLWSGVEVSSKRLVVPQCQAVMADEEAGPALLMGVLIQFVCLLTITGLMTVRPF